MTLDRRRLAVRTAKLRSHSEHPTSAAGFCLREVRECFRIDPTDPPTFTAYQAWERARNKHRAVDIHSLKDIPRGVPLFWAGGSNGDGHVAISTGFRMRCFSTDILRTGYFDKVEIGLIHAKWGLRFLGWTEDLNGVRVYP